MRAGGGMEEGADPSSFLYSKKEEAEPSILFMMVNIDTIPVKCPSKKGLKSKMIAIINIGGLRIGA